MSCLLPTVLRARGYRLYTKGGQRLTDLWLNGGAAVLGHTPANLLRELKNAASRGLYAPFPHFTEDRLIKALSLLFPNHSFRLYAAPPPELALITGRADINLWRPYTDSSDPFAVNDTPLLVPVIPGIQNWRGGLPFGLFIAAVKNGLDLKLPPGDTLSPIVLAAAARGIYDIIASPERGMPNLPRVIKALRNSRWQRSGIYLTLKKKPALQEWETLFNKFLDAGFLLPPTQEQPVILPGEMSDGEEAKLAAVIEMQRISCGR
ncbi:MAG: hypothetical protein LBH16_12490 [Treponema sp.]|jgi:hypothetical protein|nr:hypothetical protein [Treponema sp.]